jgi:recombination DNA repair RAD52 pathway protein
MYQVNYYLKGIQVHHHVTDNLEKAIINFKIVMNFEYDTYEIVKVVKLVLFKESIR